MKKKSLLETLLPTSEKQQRSQTEIEKAHHKAEKIVEDAVDKSADILQKTVFVDKELKDELSVELKAAVAEIAAAAKAEIESEIANAMNDFSAALTSTLKSSEDDIKAKIDSQYSTVQEEIANYKRDRVATIDEQVKIQVAELARQIFGKTISGPEHDRLVREAIEEAVGKGIFFKERHEDEQK